MEVGRGARLVLRRIALEPSAAARPPHRTLEITSGGEVVAEDIRIDGKEVAVLVSKGAIRLERAIVTVQLGATAIQGETGATVEFLASDIRSGGIGVAFWAGGRLAIEGATIHADYGLQILGGAPDVHIAAADVRAFQALYYDAEGSLTIYGARFFGEFALRGRPSVAVEGALFASGASLEMDLPSGSVARFVRSRFASRSEPLGSVLAEPAVRLRGSGGVEFSDNMVAAKAGAAMIVERGIHAEISHNLFAGALILPEGGWGTTEAELLLWDSAPSLDEKTNLLTAAFAADPDLTRRLNDAAADAAMEGTDEAFDRLMLLGEEARKACAGCAALEPDAGE